MRALLLVPLIWSKQEQLVFISHGKLTMTSWKTDYVLHGQIGFSEHARAEERSN